MTIRAATAHRLGAAAVVLGLLTPACGDSGFVAGSDDFGDSGGETTANDEDTGDPEAVGELARGVSVLDVRVNQGVAVAVADGGGWIGGTGRNARLIAGRPSLVQVRFERSAAVASREVEVWLVLEHTTLPLDPLRILVPASAPSQVEVDFLLDPKRGHTDPGVTFRVELRDPVGAPVNEAALEQALSPADGPGLIGFEPLTLVPEIVLVPVHRPGEPAPDIDEEKVHGWLMAWMPASTIELSVHAPLEVEYGKQLGGSFFDLDGLRQQEMPADDVSYVGVVADPDRELDAWAVGFRALPVPEDAASRLAMVALGSGSVADERIDASSFAFALYIHHGMESSDCPDVDWSPSDPDYPYPDGKIGVWGWDMSENRLLDPGTTYDLSTHCEPRWISDYTWTRTLDSLRITSGW